MRKVIVIVALVLLLLVGCSSGKQTMPYDEYLEAFKQATHFQGQAEHWKAQSEVANKKIKQLEALLSEEKDDFIPLEANIQQLQQEVAGLKGNLASEMRNTSEYFANKTRLESEVASLTQINKQTQESYQLILDKYNALLSIYPPRKFASLEVLKLWREEKGVVKDIATLQQLAYTDGYLLIARSSDCLAVVGDNIYRLLPSDPDYVGTGALTITAEFNSIAEAEQFVSLNENKLPIVLIANASGKIVFSNYQHNSRYDCDDYADDWENIAAASGFKFAQVPVINGRIWGVKVTNLSSGLHVGNWTKINNTYYYLETSPSSSRWNLVKILDAD